MADEDEKGEDEAGTDSPAIKALKREKEELGLRAEIAASRRSLAGLGLSEVKTPEGEIKIDGETPIEGVILAYRALDRVAGVIARRVAEADPKPARVLLHDAAAFKAFSALSALRIQLDLLDREAEALIRETEALTGESAKSAAKPRGGFESAAGFAMSTAGGLISSAVELASLFRRDVALTYGKVEPAERSLVVAVAGALKANGIAVIDSAMVPVDPVASDDPVDPVGPVGAVAPVDPVDPVGGSKGSELRTKLEALQGRRLSLAALGRALASARKARTAKGKAEPDQPEDQDSPASLQAPKTGGKDAQAADAPTREEAAEAEVEDAPAADEPTPQEAAISAMVATLAAFLDGLLKVDETTGAVRLAQMLDAEKVAARVDANAAFLWLKIDAAGGASRTTKSLLSSRVDYSGGAVASFALYGRDGALIDAGIVPGYSGFVTVGADLPAP